jgi:eukaryotic-like serine/threonine-protein kinase
MGESATRARHNLEPGLKLDGRYELLCILAQGGMANVWLARFQGKHGFTKLVAVKTILPHIAEDEHFKQMFLDEARVAAHIEHPNVVQINDVGDHGGVSYLVMDLVEGESLQGILKACDKQGKRLPLGVALRVLADACLGLDAAHELRDPSGRLMNVVHRDISPQNILVTVAGTAKVIDFGIAKARDRATSDTSAGTLKGKISFMPHEQALGREVDRRTDTWALGAVLYMLLCGRPPYKGEHQLATLQLVMSGAPIVPLPDQVPAVIRSIVAKALMHDPAHRFQTARELGMALEDAMNRLGLGTTTVQVAQLLQERIGDKLQERRDFVQSALAEAANRERVRNMLLTAPTVDADGSGSLRQPVAFPPELGSQPHMMQPMMQTHLMAQSPYAQGHHPQSGAMAVGYAQGPYAQGQGLPPTQQTLVATTVEPLGRPVRSGPSPVIVIGALVVSLAMAAGGGFLIFKYRKASGAKEAAVTVASPTPTPVPVPVVSAGASDHGANGMPNVDMSQVGVTPPVMAAAAPSASASASGQADAGAKVGAVAAAAAATGTAGSRPKPVAAPAVPAVPKPVAVPVAKKGHDDEAGF